MPPPTPVPERDGDGIFIVLGRAADALALGRRIRVVFNQHPADTRKIGEALRQRILQKRQVAAVHDDAVRAVRRTRRRDARAGDIPRRQPHLGDKLQRQLRHRLGNLVRAALGAGFDASLLENIALAVADTDLYVRSAEVHTDIIHKTLSYPFVAVRNTAASFTGPCPARGCGSSAFC